MKFTASPRNFLLCFSVVCAPLVVATAQTISAQPTPLVIEAAKTQGTVDGKEDWPLKSTQDLSTLYKSEADKQLVSLSEILSAYQSSYKASKASRPWWLKLTPAYGWITAAILLFGLIVQDFFKTKITSFCEWLWEQAYQQLAGTWVFRWLALRRYRIAVVQNNSIVKIPFRPDRPLDMDRVYVRLHAVGSGSSEIVEAERVLEVHSSCIVLGPPGSGKSMLLRKLALEYTQKKIKQRVARIPVLVDLNRYNEAGGNLEDRISAVFGENDFPNASHFVRAALKRGYLMLLLDGLDEVATEVQGNGHSARAQVVEQITTLMRLYRQCSYLVTCRNAVYHGELDDCVKSQLQINEFNDHQIRLFMEAWTPSMPPEKKTVEQLMKSLAERPRILALARNPLLLTIIAFLYTDTEFLLPHSRAEFYSKAVLFLLDQWKVTQNRFRGPQKAIVLQRLALWNQDISSSDSDRRTMGFQAILNEITSVLPSLNLSLDQAQAVLDEITERSGLLIAIDGGRRYQFSHLTLQEFFAAQALENDSAGLLDRYFAVPDDWRETVKLWCGLPHNSTNLIQKLRQSDPVLAFECISDAEQVDEVAWRALLDECKIRLGETGRYAEAIIRSFGLVAADPRERGQVAFAYLKEIVSSRSKDDLQVYAATCQALASTNLSLAADLLTESSKADPAVRQYLLSMGDIAIPGLQDNVLGNSNNDGTLGQFDDWPIALLRQIGTFGAVRSLVKILCDSQSKVFRAEAAWAVLSLIRDQSICRLLESIQIPDETASKHLLWIWDPFAQPPFNSGRIIARAVNAIIADEARPLAEMVVDKRVAIAYCILLETSDNLLSVQQPRDVIRQKGRKDPNLQEEPTFDIVKSHELDERKMTRTQNMWTSVPESVRAEIGQRKSFWSTKHWRNIAAPPSERFLSYWQAAIGLVIYMALISIGVTASHHEWNSIWPTNTSQSWLWLALFAVSSAAVIPIIYVTTKSLESEPNPFDFFRLASWSLIFGMFTGLLCEVFLRDQSIIGYYDRFIACLAFFPVVAVAMIQQDDARAAKTSSSRTILIWFCLSVAPVVVAYVSCLLADSSAIGRSSLNLVLLFGLLIFVFPTAFAITLRASWTSNSNLALIFLNVVLIYLETVCGAYGALFLVSRCEIFFTVLIAILSSCLLVYCMRLASYSLSLANDRTRLQIRKELNFLH